MPVRGKKTILVIDDEKAIRESFHFYLEDSGYAVHEAKNGQEGLKMIGQKKPDAVLVDLRMPKVDGLDVLAYLQKTYPDIPAIVISGTGVISDAVEALRFGAWDYILKPVEDMSLIKHSVEKAFERVRLIEENREYQKHLEKKISEKTKDLNKELTARKKIEKEREKLIKELERKNAELERFAYTVSHDLKGPLITIKNFAGLLRKDADKVVLTDRRVNSDIKYIENAADRMYHLLDGVLQLSKEGRIMGVPVRISFEELLKEVLVMLEGAIRSRNANVVVRSGFPRVYCDRQRIIQVVMNIIENAIKFTDKGITPEIEVGTRKYNGKTVVFVKDNGIGIDPRYHSKIFDIFDQLDPASEGIGLGLAYARRIVDLHGGKIWVESKGKGKGSTVCFILPEEDPKSGNNNHDKKKGNKNEKKR